MRGQIAAQQFGVTACQHDVYLDAQEAVDKQRPFVDVLYFVEKDIFEIPVYFIQYLENIVQVVRTKAVQSFIVKINVCKFDVGVCKRLQA